LAAAIAETRVGTLSEIKGVLGPMSPRSMSNQNQLQRRGLSTAFKVGEKLVMGALLSINGMSPLYARHAGRIVNKMLSLDPKLDAPGFGREWFEQNGRAYPAAPDFGWMMQYCDLCLIETTTSIGFPMEKWRR
jgi:hypothetical protein